MYGVRAAELRLTTCNDVIWGGKSSYGALLLGHVTTSQMLDLDPTGVPMFENTMLISIHIHISLLTQAANPVYCLL